MLGVGRSSSITNHNSEKQALLTRGVQDWVKPVVFKAVVGVASRGWVGRVCEFGLAGEEKALLICSSISSARLGLKSALPAAQTLQAFFSSLVSPQNRTNTPSQPRQRLHITPS